MIAVRGLVSFKIIYLDMDLGFPLIVLLAVTKKGDYINPLFKILNDISSLYDKL